MRFLVLKVQTIPLVIGLQTKSCKMKTTKNQRRLLKILNFARRNKMNIEVRAGNKKLSKSRRLNKIEYDIEHKKNEALISKASEKKVKFHKKTSHVKWFRNHLKKNKSKRDKNKINGDLSSR
jgi:hypothetical protein